MVQSPGGLLPGGLFEAPSQPGTYMERKTRKTRKTKPTATQLALAAISANDFVHTFLYRAIV